MRTIHSIAQSLEEASREDEQEGKWYARPLAFCINSSLADKLSGPLRYVCFSPLVVLIVIAVLYVLFLIVFCPLWLLSYIITVAGSYLVFFVMFHYLAVYITRSIAFPGSTTAAQQQISAEVLRRIAAYLDGLASSTNEVCALLILVFAGQLDVAEVQSIQREILSIWMSAQYLPNIFYGVSQAVDFLKHEKKLSPEETISVNQLTKGMEDFSNTLQNLLNALTQNDVRKLQDRSFVSRLAKELPFRAQELSNSTGRCLAASESLRVSAGIVRPKPSGDDESDILGMIRPLLAWNSGVTGYDQLAFPFMRALLQRTYGAKIFSVKGSNDNFVDCLYINAEEARSIRAARASGSEYQAPPASATPVHSNKLVLFCGPNAGFFETIAQMDYETSWCGYYVSKGIDFVAFNYRGYGRSTGSPTPTALKADSIKVFDHVMKTYRPKTVLIHGESIGGMVACHLARNCAVNAVLCDRTFGSLDAAARRIMAQWAGSAVKYLALWNTNVIDDYLSVSCAKLVIQDPQDEIIAHAASLKSGISARIVMGDHVLKIPYEPRDYVYARYQQSALPHEDDCCAWLAAARLTTSYLPFEFLAHFYAACASVAAKYEESKPKADVIAASTGSSTKEPHGHSLDPTNLGGTENIIAESNNLKALANKLSKRPSYSQPMLGAKLANHVRLYQMNLLEDVSIGGRLMSPYAKAWFAISRVRGSAGQMLNHALCKSLDDTVAWICNYIVWSEMDSTDNDAGTIPRAVADLRAFATSLHVLELGTNSAITFIIQALECIEERRVHFCAQKHRSKRSDDLETAITGSPVSVVGLERTAMLDSSCCSRSSHSTRGQESLDVVASNIGDLVTFSCGHNGWPQVNELDQVTAWLSSKTLMLTK